MNFTTDASWPCYTTVYNALLRYRKDDEELKVGASLSKMIVPHPALQSFIAVEILYTAYSGWISSGLAKWSIDKISLLDAFGRR